MTSAIRFATVILLCLLLGGCNLKLRELWEKPSVVISDYCLNAEVIRPSRLDTPGTLRKIAKNNSRYRALCGDENASSR